jgi:hypothetical protein
MGGVPVDGELVLQHLKVKVKRLVTPRSVSLWSVQLQLLKRPYDGVEAEGGRG